VRDAYKREERAMPHIIVKLWPGRTEAQKNELTAEIVKSVVRIAKCKESSVSVAFEEVAEHDWAEHVYQPDIVEKGASLYKKPGYNPFKDP
jgi:4-oxalocrotonate tautomerase